MEANPRLRYFMSEHNASPVQGDKVDIPSNCSGGAIAQLQKVPEVRWRLHQNSQVYIADGDRPARVRGRAEEEDQLDPGVLSQEAGRPLGPSPGLLG